MYVVCFHVRQTERQKERDTGQTWQNPLSVKYLCSQPANSCMYVCTASYARSSNPNRTYMQVMTPFFPFLVKRNKKGKDYNHITNPLFFPCLDDDDGILQQLAVHDRQQSRIWAFPSVAHRWCDITSRATYAFLSLSLSLSFSIWYR